MIAFHGKAEGSKKPSDSLNADLAYLLTRLRTAEAVCKVSKRVKGVCRKPGMADPFDDGWKWFYRLEDALTAWKTAKKKDVATRKGGRTR